VGNILWDIGMVEEEKENFEDTQQAQLSPMQLSFATKSVICNYFLVAYDTFNCIKQVAKDSFASSHVLPLI
jgi:hypothetical protein